METSEYQYLIGKEKKEIIEELGAQFNYYHSEIWTYHIKTNWLGKKRYLLIAFKDENRNKENLCKNLILIINKSIATFLIKNFRKRV